MYLYDNVVDQKVAILFYFYLDFFNFVRWNHFDASSKQALGILETGYIIMIHDGGFMHAGRALKQRRLF